MQKGGMEVTREALKQSRRSRWSSRRRVGAGGSERDSWRWKRCGSASAARSLSRMGSSAGDAERSG
eukprot:6226592-Alexandrium_andersonii.AAC.1